MLYDWDNLRPEAIRISLNSTPELLKLNVRLFLNFKEF